MHRLRILISVAALLAYGAAQAADNAVIVTPGVGVTMRSKDIGAGVQAMMPILSDTSGNAIYGTAGSANANVITVQGVASMTALKVDGSAVTQPVSAASLPLPSNAAQETGGNLATLAGAIAASRMNANARITGNAGGVVDFAGQNATAPASALLAGCMFVTTPTTITTGNASPCQLDSAANLLVNVKAGTVAATQSGTWNITNVSGTVSLPTGAATAAKQPALGTAGSASTDVITIQGISSMTKLLVTPDSVALPANQSVNVSQVNGVTTLTGAGATGTGAQRFTTAQDTTTIAGSAPGTAGSASANVVTIQGVASMTKLLVTPDSVALPANQSVNVAQINGVTPLMNNGTTGTGSPRVTLASDNSALPAAGQGATGAAAPAGATQMGALTGDATTGGHMKAPITCDNHVFKHITTATDTLAVQGVTSQTIYVCGWRSRAAGTATWFLENTASTNANCSSSNTQLTGVASEIANSGETLLAPFWTGLKNTAANGLCINSTGTGGVDVDVWYTIF